jgi:hypothetical protein
LSSIIPSDGSSPFDAPLIKGVEAHIYVLGFESGIVKVGRTAAPDRRIGLHKHHGEAYGNPLVHTWLSGPHAGAIKNETALIGFCAKRARNSGGREYFTGIPFETVRDYASSLEFLRGDREEHERTQRATAAQRRSLMALLDGRSILLPERVSLPAPEGTARERALLGDYFGLSENEVRQLSPAVHEQIKAHVVEFVNLQQDSLVLEDLHAKAAERLRECLTTGRDKLRQEIHDALERDGLPSRNRPALPGAQVVRLPQQRRNGGVA